MRRGGGKGEREGGGRERGRERGERVINEVRLEKG